MILCKVCVPCMSASASTHCNAVLFFTVIHKFYRVAHTHTSTLYDSFALTNDRSFSREESTDCVAVLFFARSSPVSAKLEKPVLFEELLLELLFAEFKLDLDALPLESRRVILPMKLDCNFPKKESCIFFKL